VGFPPRYRWYNGLKVLADEMINDVDAILEEAYQEALQKAYEEAYEAAYKVAYEDAYRKAKRDAEQGTGHESEDESGVLAGDEVVAGEGVGKNFNEEAEEENQGIGEQREEGANSEEAEAHATIEQPQEDDPPPVADGAHHILRAGNCPLEIGLWREILFKLDTTIELPVHQFEPVWPYMTNCWSFNSNSYQYGDHFL
jgi:hypothetical protein